MSLPVPGSARSVTLDGKVVLVTGATGGLGEAVARACAAAGATVVIHGRIVRRLEALFDAIVAAGHPEPAILPLDLAKAAVADFDRAAGALRAELGHLDALIHTATILGSLGPIEHQSFDRWLDVLRVNVAAAMGLTRAMMPLLGESGDASVTFTLDSRGRAPRAYWGAYGVAKAGVGALAAIVADEWEHRPALRVNAVVPGPMRSPLRTLTHPGEDKAGLPLPDAVVPLYLHLIGSQAKADSGRLIDAAAWLAGRPAEKPLVSPCEHP